MALELPYGIRVASTDPVDYNRYHQPDLAGRDALVPLRAEVSQQVYVDETETLYILKGITGGVGTWESVGGGEATLPGALISSYYYKFGVLNTTEYLWTDAVYGVGETVIPFVGSFMIIEINVQHPFETSLQFSDFSGSDSTETYTIIGVPNSTIGSIRVKYDVSEEGTNFASFKYTEIVGGAYEFRVTLSFYK